MLNFNLKATIIFFIISVLIVSCGFKGPLYLSKANIGESGLKGDTNNRRGELAIESNGVQFKENESLGM